MPEGPLAAGRIASGTEPRRRLLARLVPTVRRVSVCGRGCVINGWEIVIIFILAMLLIGPERLPTYVAKLKDWVRQAKSFADGAKGQLREQLGPEFDDIAWKNYDPRQYDPRRIVRDALNDLGDADTGSTAAGEEPPRSTVRPRSVAYDPDRPTPFDNEAT